MTALFVAQAGNTLLSYNSQKKQAQAQQSASNAQTEADMAALGEQQIQINAAADEDIGQRAREAMIERGRLRAVAADSGLTDNTGRIENESRFAEGADITSIDANRKRSLTQNAAEAKAAAARGQARSASIKQPSLIGTGLQIAGGYYGMQDQIAERKTTIKR